MGTQALSVRWVGPRSHLETWTNCRLIMVSGYDKELLKPKGSMYNSYKGFVNWLPAMTARSCLSHRFSQKGSLCSKIVGGDWLYFLNIKWKQIKNWIELTKLIVYNRTDAVPKFRRELGRVWNFNQSINGHHHKKDHVEIGYLTKNDAFRVNRDQVMDPEIWFKIWYKRL